MRDYAVNDLNADQRDIERRRYRKRRAECRGSMGVCIAVVMTVMMAMVMVVMVLMVGMGVIGSHARKS
jgi:hypothetical protein